MSKSIFKFGHLYALDTPFDDWITKRRNKEIKQIQEALEPQEAAVCTSLKTPPKGFKAMLTLSGIVNPNPRTSTPGKAHLTIHMEYQTITAGEGAVERLDFIVPHEFHALYAKGNTILQLKTLPCPNTAAQQLNATEQSYALKKNPTTKKRVFWNFYEVTVVYDFNLNKAANYTLWEGLQWQAAFPQSRGLFFVAPFLDPMKKWNERIKNITLKTIEDSLSSEEKEELEGLSEEEKKSKLNPKLILRKLKEAEVIYLFYDAYNLYLLLKSDAARYRNKHIVFHPNYAGWAISSTELSDIPPLSEWLKNNKTTLHSGTEQDVLAAHPKLSPSDVVKLSPNANDQYLNQMLVLVMNFAISFYPSFVPDANENITIGAAGSTESPNNVVLLNHLLYGAINTDKKFHFGNLSSTEVLVHEAGHNAAAAFTHSNAKTGNYEYHHEGLSSNKRGKIYPTRANTLGILNDPTNRSNMNIK